jgi:DNA-binding PadR family transcriptional regulator
MKELGRRLSPSHLMSAGSVYPVLKQLEQAGLVDCETQAGRNVYSLTKGGKREVARESKAIDRIWRRLRMAESGGEGDVTTSLHRLIKAAYRAAEASVGQPEREALLRATLNQAAMQLDAILRMNESEEG